MAKKFARSAHSKKRRTGKFARVRKILLGSTLFVLFLGAGFGFYIWSLYHQLTESFNREDEFVPARIYSDVTPITLHQPRSLIEERLKNLAYTYTADAQSIHFSLHPMDYPHSLIPQNAAQLFIPSPQVELTFDSPGKMGHLQAIQIHPGFEGDHEEGESLSESSSPQPAPSTYAQEPDGQKVFLEPEWVATLSKNGDLPDSRREIRTHLKFDEIPAPVWKAIISIEDQHFLEHRGFDPRGLARALWVNLRTFSFAQGGSTITQQLVKNLMARRTKNVFRKVNELFLSLLLELRFEKEEILERYLNEVYLGQVGSLEVHGVAEGAEHFFGKKLEDLNLAEIALMAGLIRGPGYYSPYRYKERATERLRLVLRKMVETGQIAEEEAQAALKLPIRLIPPQTVTTKAPFFTDYVKAELTRLLKKRMSEQEIIASGFRIYTTLDPRLNEAAQKAVSNGIHQLEKRLKLTGNERLEGALAAVDHRTGFLRALIGGKNYAKSNFNRILNMRRQVGSTFKPIVYLSALKKGEDDQGVPYGPGYPVEDAPWTLVYDGGKRNWSPKNYGKKNLGWISMRKALTQSINTVAAKLGTEVGLDAVIQSARDLGIESPLPRVPSLALGTAELTPIELLRVYATLANRGVQEEFTVIRAITRSNGVLYNEFTSYPKQVFDPAPIDVLTDMLQGVFLDGTAQAAKQMGFDFPAAGKTGTTNNHRDAWFAGYTPDLTAVVWTGLDHPSDKDLKLTLTGAGTALPIWVNFMSKALEGTPRNTFPPSPFLTEIHIDTHTGKAALSTCPSAQVLIEKYVRGHEPKDQTCESSWPHSSPRVVKE